MLVRIISALVGCAIIIPTLFFSHTWALPILLSFITIVSMFEMLRCIGVHKKIYLSLPVIVFAAITPLIARLSEIDGDNYKVVFVLLSGAVLFVFYVLAISLFSKGDFLIKDAAMVYMTGFYIIGGYTSIVLLRDLDGIGHYIYVIVFLGSWMTDTFAYLVGKAIGKHKLIPEISPHKTVEGSIGGVVCCIITLIVYAFILQKFFGQNPNYFVFAGMGLVISVVSQIGDLMMSQLKRSYNIKDFGKIMPGHGGLLDRFDSVLAVSLILIIFCGIVQGLGIKIM